MYNNLGLFAKVGLLIEGLDLAYKCPCNRRILVFGTFHFPNVRWFDVKILSKNISEK